MTVDEIRKRVAEIESIKDDNEAAHSKTDRLYIDVLRAIAARGSNTDSDLAVEALKAQEIEFSRWCA